MKIKEKWQRFGVLAAGHQLLYRIAQRCVSLSVTHLMTMRLDELTADEDSADRVEFRALSREEFKALVKRSELELDPLWAERIAIPLDTCFAAVRDGQLIAYFWLATDSIEAIHNSPGDERLGVALSFPADTVYTYNAFVHPDHRGAGLYTRMVRAAGQWAHEQLRVDRLISTVDWTNCSAIRSCHRQGRRSIGLIWRVGVLGRWFTFAPRATRDYGIATGDAAVVRDRHDQARGLAGTADPHRESTGTGNASLRDQALGSDAKSTAARHDGTAICFGSAHASTEKAPL